MARMRSMPIWDRAPRARDEYALAVMNPEELDVIHLRRLLQAVIDRPGCRRTIGFSGPAAEGFCQWLSDFEEPLPSQAYARLSNWFLTDSQGEARSARGHAAGVFWDALFRVRPPRRLASPQRNHRILPEVFNLWWPQQVARQREAGG